jgi:hypothetical protein
MLRRFPNKSDEEQLWDGFSRYAVTYYYQQERRVVVYMRVATTVWMHFMCDVRQWYKRILPSRRMTSNDLILPRCRRIKTLLKTAEPTDQEFKIGKLWQ